MSLTPDGGGTIHRVKVAVGTGAAVPLVPARGRRTGLVLQVLGAANVFIGEDSTVTATGATQGLQLTGNQATPFILTSIVFSGSVWAIADGAGASVLVLDIY